MLYPQHIITKLEKVGVKDSTPCEPVTRPKDVIVQREREEKVLHCHDDVGVSKEGSTTDDVAGLRVECCNMSQPIAYAEACQVKM